MKALLFAGNSTAARQRKVKQFWHFCEQIWKVRTLWKGREPPSRRSSL